MTKILYNNPKGKEVRRKLRKESTSQEKILWEHIRNNKLGLKFRRQYGIGGYILDFYCPAKRLAIEFGIVRWIQIWKKF